jgi:putative membrane protein
MIYSFVSNVLGLMLIFWMFDDIYVVPTVVRPGDQFKIIILAAIMLALINTFVKPILKIVSFPLMLITLGLFYFVLNAFILAFVAWIIPEIEIKSLLSLFVAAFLLSVINNIGHKLFKH